MTLPIKNTKLLSDENIATSVTQGPKSLGYDIISVYDLSFANQPDKIILKQAIKDQRIIITHDKDFAELIKTINQPVSVIHISPANQPPKRIINRIRNLLPMMQNTKNETHIYHLYYNQVSIVKIK